jgi:thiosulfate dehydrogenase [quinone] large subunit
MLDHEWYTWFAKIVAVGEVLVGIGLIVGALVGIAAFFGTFMNFNFQLAGSASTNPVLFGLSVFLILAWKTAGHYGLDRYLLPALGTPWKLGRLFSTAAPAKPETAQPSASTI